MVGFSPHSGEVACMKVYEALSLMIAFGILVATIISACK